MTDTDVAPEGDRERLKALLPRFSREDLLRSFDVLTRAESDIRGAAEPRYHLEMALLRWIHLRKLMPHRAADRAPRRAAPRSRGPGPSRGFRAGRVRPVARARAGAAVIVGQRRAAPAVVGPARGRPRPPAARRSRRHPRRLPRRRAPAPPAAASPAAPATPASGTRSWPPSRRPSPCSTARRSPRRAGIDVDGDRVRFRFGPSQTMAADRVSQREAAGSRRSRCRPAGRRDGGDGRNRRGGAGGGGRRPEDRRRRRAAPRRRRRT